MQTFSGSYNFIKTKQNKTIMFIFNCNFSMHPRYQEPIRALSCVLCTCVLTAVNDDVEREHKDTRLLHFEKQPTSLFSAFLELAIQNVQDRGQTRFGKHWRGMTQETCITMASRWRHQL